MAKPIAGDRRGAVLVILSLILPVILLGILGLMGISGFANARSDLKAASDAAANAVLADLNSTLQISATPDALVTIVDKQARAEAIVNSLLATRDDLSNIDTRVTTTDTTISVTVSAQIRNTTGDMFWTPFISSSATSTVSWAKADQLQVILSVDGGPVTGIKPLVALQTATTQLVLSAAIDILAILPNYPDIAVSLVPFTAQIATDPTLVLAQNEDDSSSDFLTVLQNRFAELRNGTEHLFFPKAYAGVTACYNEPILPSGSSVLSFGGSVKPMPAPCASSVVAIRPLRKISGLFKKGTPLGLGSSNSPEGIARNDIKSAINAISPSGCRNLSMGVTWALKQLPADNNPKVVFLVANGNNSQSPKGKTSQCAATTGGTKLISQAQLDADFVAACQLVRDPSQNKGRQLDLIVLQVIDGNPTSLSSCASTTGTTVNFTRAFVLSDLQKTFDLARTYLFTAAREQVRKKQINLACKPDDSKGESEEKNKNCSSSKS